MKIQPILEATQQAVYSHGAKEIAADLGHSFEYLRKIVNPDPDPDEERHIQLRSFLRIIELTGDIKPLELALAELGYRLVPMNGEPDGADMAEELLQGYAATHDFLDKARCGAHYTKLYGPMRAAMKELEDVYKRSRKECHKLRIEGRELQAVKQ